MVVGRVNGDVRGMMMFDVGENQGGSDVVVVVFVVVLRWGF